METSTSWILILEQHGGCDYTIGCGLYWDRIIFPKPVTVEYCLDWIKKAWIGEEFNWTYKLGEADRAYLFPCGPQRTINLDEWHAYRDRLREPEPEDPERAEYERLKKKFG